MPRRVRRATSGQRRARTSRRRSRIGCARNLLVAAAWFLAAPLQAATISVEIQGLAGEMAEAARAATGLRELEERDLSSQQIRRLFELAEEQVREALEPFGYYHAQVEASLEKTQRDSYRAIFRVTPGDPVIVQQVNVSLTDEATSLPEVRAALDAFAPTQGDRLDHAVYERSKSRIDAALRATGFLDAMLTEHRVAVTRAANFAQIDLAWDAGARHRLGAVRFSEAQFPDEFLQRFVPWREGEFYSSERLLELQQRLVDAGYFASVGITPDLQDEQDDVVPLNVLLIPAKRTVYTAGAYLSTDYGFGGRLGVDRRWVNRRGHTLGAEIEYSQRLQEVSASYRIPRPDVRNRHYAFGVGYRDEQTDSSRSRMSRVGATQVTDRWKGFTRTLALQYLGGDFEIAEQRGETSLLYAEGLLVRREADDRLFPLRGYMLSYDARLGAQALLSDTDFLQLRVDGRWVRQIGQDGRAILRGAVGAMAVDEFDALPPELQFFAGGDHSVRGFNYQQIGEINEQGDVIGGEYLLAASIEYEHYFLQKWGAAAFVDAGDAFTSRFEANVGAGIGLRWKSPIGLVRVDIARPVVTDFDKSWQLHIVIGPDL
jgi:translocation and assembly module TamA